MKNKTKIITIASIILLLCFITIVIVIVKQRSDNESDSDKIEKKITRIWGSDQVHINLTAYTESDVSFLLPYLVDDSIKNEKIELVSVTGKNIESLDVSLCFENYTALNIVKSGYRYETLPVKVSPKNRNNAAARIDQFELKINDKIEVVKLDSPFIFEFIEGDACGVSERFSLDSYGSGHEMQIREVLGAYRDTKLNRVFINDFIQMEGFSVLMDDVPVYIGDPQKINLEMKEEDIYKFEFTTKPGEYLHDLIITTVCYEFEDGNRYIFPIYQYLIGAEREEEMSNSFARMLERAENEK